MAAVLSIAAILTLALGMIFPVQFALDTSGYRETGARTWAPLNAKEADISDVRTALGGERVAVVLEFLSEVSVDGRRSAPVSLSAILGDDLDADLTLMPDSTRVAGPPRDRFDGGDWVDISADIARDLDVGPGDTIDVVVSPDEPATLTVRGVYAARERGLRGLAIAPAAAVARHDASIDLTSTSMFTTARTSDVERMLNTPPWRDRMLEANYTLPITVESMPDRLARAEDLSFANLGLVLTVSLLALAALLAIIVAETTALLASTFRPRAEILLELGARPRAMYRGVALVVCATVTAAVAIGSALAALAYAEGWVVGPAVPPSLTSAWWGATGLSIAVGAVTTIVVTARERRRITA